MPHGTAVLAVIDVASERLRCLHGKIEDHSDPNAMLPMTSMTLTGFYKACATGLSHVEDDIDDPSGVKIFENQAVDLVLGALEENHYLEQRTNSAPLHDLHLPVVAELLEFTVLAYQSWLDLMFRQAAGCCMYYVNCDSFKWINKTTFVVEVSPIVSDTE